MIEKDNLINSNIGDKEKISKDYSTIILENKKIKDENNKLNGQKEKLQQELNKKNNTIDILLNEKNGKEYELTKIKENFDNLKNKAIKEKIEYQILIKQKEESDSSLKDKEREINLLNNELKALRNQKNESENFIEKHNENEVKLNDLKEKENKFLNEIKSLKVKNVLLLQENTILKSIKNEYEKYKKQNEKKQEKIQYLIETNNFNIFYDNKNYKTNQKQKFTNLIINSSICISYNKKDSNNNYIFKENNENEKYKNNYDQDEEINDNELDLNFSDDDYEDFNINYDDLNQENNNINNNENEIKYSNLDNEGEQNIKKKKKRKRKRRNKKAIIDFTNDSNFNNTNSNHEQHEININNNNIAINDEQNNKHHEQLSQSQKKKKKIKRKLNNMKSDYLSLYGEKEILLKENREYQEKIQILEEKLNENKINYEQDNYENLFNENKKYKDIISELKLQINTLKKENKKDNEETLIQLNEKILEKDMIIEELSESTSKLKKEYKLSLKQINSMKDDISNLEKNIGIEDKINNLQKIINQKEEQIIILTEQIKEYESKCDDIIIGNTEEEKDIQIKLLLIEVKSIRNKLLNILNFQGRIQNYEDFMRILNKLILYLNKNENEEIKIICQKLKFLAENYELSGQKYYNKIMQEIFGINYDEFDKETNDDIIEEKEYKNEDNIDENFNEKQNDNIIKTK